MEDEMIYFLKCNFAATVLAFWLLIVVPAGAQPVGDYRPNVEGCGRYYATTDVIACLGREADLKNIELKRTISELFRLIDVSKNKSWKDKFSNSQILFEKYRDSNCKTIEFNYREGSVGPGFYYSCFILLTDQRIKVIKHDYALIIPKKEGDP